MVVTVKDILALEAFSQARLLAGDGGIGNIISQVTIVDTPVERTDWDYRLANPGELYISSFYIAQNSLKDMQDYVSFMVETKASCLCLIDNYISQLPPQICAYCDENNLPVVMVSGETPYALMIRAITKMLLLDQENLLIQNQIYTLTQMDISDAHKTKILMEINPYFHKCLSAIYIVDPSGMVLLNKYINLFTDIFNSDSHCFGAKYQNGVLGLVSYGFLPEKRISERIELFVKRLLTACPKDIRLDVGVSEHNLPLLECDRSISQAIAAASFALGGNTKPHRVVYYSQLGLSKLLLLLRGQPETKAFCQEVLGPIYKEDQKNNLELFRTLQLFFNNDRDYKRTASQLFVHENTVRHRINKVLSLVSPQKNREDAFLMLAVALKLRQLAIAEQLD